MEVVLSDVATTAVDGTGGCAMFSWGKRTIERAVELEALVDNTRPRTCAPFVGLELPAS